MQTRMRHGIVLFMLVAFCALAPAQDDPKKKVHRFGFPIDETTFPQKTPTETMKSIVTAIDRKKIDYMLAHMVDPDYVDYWINRYKEDLIKGKDDAKRLLAFDRLVSDTSTYFQNDPLIVRDLRVFAKEGKWEEKENNATGVVDTIPARKVFLKKIGERWFLENRQE